MSAIRFVLVFVLILVFVLHFGTHISSLISLIFSSRWNGMAGGTRKSGLGRENGEEGFLDYVRDFLAVVRCS